MYQDHLTKCILFRLLTHKMLKKWLMLCLIFSQHLVDLRFDGEFVNKIINELCNTWTNLEIVHGKPLHSQSQESVEKANQNADIIIVQTNCSYS